jgi:hypothetical protein
MNAGPGATSRLSGLVVAGLTVVPHFSSPSAQLLEYSGHRDVHHVDEPSAIAQTSLRSHTKAIYRKLDGSSRDEVFEPARELGLIASG